MATESDIAQMDIDYFNRTKGFLIGVTDNQLDFIEKRIKNNQDVSFVHFASYYIKRHKITYKAAKALRDKYFKKYAQTWPDEDYILPYKDDE